MTDEKLKEIAQEKCGKYCGSSCYSHAIEHYKMGYKSRDEEVNELSAEIKWLRESLKSLSERPAPLPISKEFYESRLPLPLFKPDDRK
jgi:hypothetical protein